MAFKKKYIYEIIGAALVLSALLSTASAFDCLGKSFHCVNSSHFMICVDVGGGVSQSIDDFTIPCPPPTVCQGNNHFECEFPIMTTPSTTLSNVISESSMPWEEVDVTTVLPPQNTTKEYSEKYMNTESLTSLPANIYTTDATVDYTTEAASLVDSISIAKTRPAVTESLLYDTTTSMNDIGRPITDHNVASGGELLIETVNNYTLGQEATTDEGLVSASTIKEMSSKLNATEATSLINDVNITETIPTVTEALPDDTTTIQNVITQIITEHNETSAGDLLAETANNNTFVRKVTDYPGLVYTSTEKAVSSKLYTTEAASLIDDISLKENSPAGTEALPYDTSTSQDFITQTITERNVASAGESLTEFANNSTLEQELTTNEGLVSTSTIKAIYSKLNATEITSLIDDISVTESGTAVTKALPDDTITNQNVITQTITEHNETSAGDLLAETANNNTFVSKVTDDAGFVYTSTIKDVPLKLNPTEAASLIDDISITETSPLVTEALPYDTTTSQDIVTQTITERNVASVGESLRETANNYALVKEETNNAGIVSPSTEKANSSKLNTTEAAPLIYDISITESGPTVTEAYDSTTSKDIITQTKTDYNVAAAGGLSTESANTLVQKKPTDEGLVSTSTEIKKVDIRKTTNVTKESAFNQVKTTSESIPTKISVVVNEISTTTDNVFATDANLINTDLWDLNTNMLDYRPTTESELATVDSIIAADANNVTTEQPAVAELLHTTLFTNSLNYATTTSESTTVENVVFNKRNLTLFGKGAVTHINTNSGIEISLGQEQNMTTNKPSSTKNMSTASSPTEQIIVDMFNNSISKDLSSILTTETVYLNTNDTWSTTNEEVLDQTKQTYNSIVTEASIGTELPTKDYAIIPDVLTVPSVDLVQNAGNRSIFNYVTTNATTMVEEMILTERPNITLFEENTVTEATTNLVPDSPLFLKQNVTDHAPIGLGSSITEPVVIPTLDTGNSINPDNFARGTGIVTTEETRYYVLDQATLGPDLIVAVTELPTSIDDNYTTETNVIKNNELPSAENTLLNTNMSNHTVTTKTEILENNTGAEQQNFTTKNTHLTEAPPHIFAKNTNDNIPNPNIVEQAPPTNNIDIEGNLATALNDNLAAKKNPIVPVKNLGNSPKHLEFVEYNATGHPKPIIIDENLLSDTDNITSSSDTENETNSSLSHNLGNSAVQHNASTEQLTIQEIQGSVTTDKVLETGQAISEANNTQKPIPVQVAASVVSSAHQIFDKTSDLDVETGTLLEDAFDNNSHTITSFTQQIDKVEVANNYHLDFATDGITKEPNYFIHGDTTSAPFIVTTALAAGVESLNKIEDHVSNTEFFLNSIRPTDVIYNALNPISNIILNTGLKQSEVDKVETTTGVNIALTSELIPEKNLNPIGNQAKEYIKKVIDSFGINEKTTESNLKESETSFHATAATDNQNIGVLPINTKSDDSGKITTLYSHGIKPELINHKDLFIAKETKQLNTSLAPTTSINDKNEATLNYNQFKYSTDSSFNDFIKNKTDLDSLTAKTEDHTSTLNAKNANENKNDLQGIIINATDHLILKAQGESTNYLTTKAKTDVLESAKSGPKVHDPQYHNPSTEYIGLDVDNYPKLTIKEESFSNVYKSTQIPLQKNYFTTTASIVTKDANIITEKSTSINGVDLNEVNVVNNNIYLPQLDTTLQRPVISSVITDKQKSYINTGNQDDDSLTTKGSNEFAADVNVASKQIGNQAIDLPEKTIVHTEATATISSHVVTQFETSTVYIRDDNQNEIDEVPSVLQTKNSTPKFPQFNDVKNVHQLIGNVFNTVSETSSQRTFTDLNYNVAQSTQENTNTKASKAWDDISSNIKGKTLESFLPRQNITIKLPTEISTDTFKPYPATSTFRTINAPNSANEAQGINNVLVTGKPIILAVRNKSTDNPLTQPQVDKEIRADVNKINTSLRVTANAEQSHVSSITPTQNLNVSRNLSQPRFIDAKPTSLNQDTNNIINMQGTLEPQDKTVTNQVAVITQKDFLNKTSINQADQTHNGITTQKNENNITSNVYQRSNFSKANESINESRKIGKTQQNATLSHKVINTVNSTTQAFVKRAPLRPVSSVAENPTKQVLSSPQFKYNCINGTRGRYSDKNDCRNFYICVGNNQPIVGTCPGNTVFSDIKKLCTRNMSHCIRENQFKCPFAGRFSDLINDVYYICVSYKNSLYRFKFQCQKGFSLNKTITRCIENKVIVPNDSISIFSSDMIESTASSTSKSSTSSISSGSRGDSDSSNSSQSTKSVEKKETEKADEPEKPDDKDEDESDEIFVCKKEGKFPIRNECRRYYLCKKNRKSEYRRKIKKCRSGDVFHKSKKRCVDAESYEC